MSSVPSQGHPPPGPPVDLSQPPFPGFVKIRRLPTIAILAMILGIASVLVALPTLIITIYIVLFTGGNRPSVQGFLALFNYIEVVGVVVAIISVVLGHISLVQLDRVGDTSTAQSMTIAGLITGYITLTLIPFILIFGLVLIPLFLVL